MGLHINVRFGIFWYWFEILNKYSEIATTDKFKLDHKNNHQYIGN